MKPRINYIKNSIRNKLRTHDWRHIIEPPVEDDVFINVRIKTVDEISVSLRERIWYELWNMLRRRVKIDRNEEWNRLL